MVKPEDSLGDFASLDRHVARMAEVVDAAERPSMMDAAVVALLRNDRVREALAPILEAGGQVMGVVASPAGTVEGIVQLEVTTQWRPGAHALGAAPVVCSILRVQPPEVIEVVTREGGPAALAAPMETPSGPLPTALQGLPRGLTPQDLPELANDRRAIVEWLHRERMESLIESLRNPATSSGAMYMTSGTKCTSWFCFEKSTDDSDVSSGLGGALTPPRQQGPYG